MSRPAASESQEPDSRRSLLWAALLVAGVTMLLAWPALGGAFLVNPSSDQYIAGFAFREFAAQSLREGRGVPLWNPYQFGGMPYVAAMHGDIFYPTFLLRLVLPTDVAMTWGFILHTSLAGWFTIGFLRASGVRTHAAMLGGVAYLLSGTVASYVSPGHDGKLFVSALLPAALWALVRGVRDGQHAAWGALALIVGLAALSPHPQLLQYLLLTAGAFALYLVVRPAAVVSDVESTSEAPANQRHGIRLVFALAAVLVGAGISAIQYLSVREYTPWSPRAGGKGWDHAVSYSFPLEETINVYLPQFSGILENYWGRNQIHLHSEYIGASVLVIAFLGLDGGLLNRHLKHAWFWIGVLVVALFWAWGGNTPFYQLVYAVVPGTKFFRAPSTILYVVAFASAVLCAFGGEQLLAGRTTRRYGVVWVAFAVVVGLIATAGGLTNLSLGLAGDRAADIQANARAVILGAWRSALFVVLTVGIMLAVANGRLTRRLAGWGLLLVVTLDLYSIDRHYWRFSAPAKTLFASDSIVAYLSAQPQPVRVIALPLSRNVSPHDPFLLGDALMHHRVRGVLGYHGNELGRYQTLYGKDDDLQAIANPNFWALTNAEFLYTNVNGVPVQGATLVAGPVRNAAGTMTYLYDLPGDHPVAWVTPRLVQLDDASARATLMNPLFDVRRVAIFEPDAKVAAGSVDAPLPDRLPVAVRSSRYEPGAIDLTIDGSVPAGSALVVSENFYPGWTAAVDGRPAPVFRADLALIGLALPVGAQKVSLRFDSAPYKRGKIITFGAVALALIMLIGGRVLDRRHVPVPAA